MNRKSASKVPFIYLKGSESKSADPQYTTLAGFPSNMFYRKNRQELYIEDWPTLALTPSFIPIRTGTNTYPATQRAQDKNLNSQRMHTKMPCSPLVFVLYA